MVRSSVFELGVLLGAMAIALLDVAQALLRMPLAPPGVAVGVSWVVTTGALAGAAVPLLLAYRAAQNALSPKTRFIASVIAGLVLGAFGLLVEEMPSIRFWVRVALTLGLGMCGGALALGTRRWPRATRLLTVLAACALFVWLERLTDRGKPCLRFAIDLTLLGACGALFEAFREKALPTRAVLGVIAALALAVPAGVLAPSVRGVVYEYASHARSLVGWAAGLGRRHVKLGSVTCDGAQHPAILGARRSVLSEAARGADVLFLSFDAMRWDHADSVPAVWRELGQHVRFTRAVSPSPRTENSFASLLRGVPSRFVASQKAAREQPTIAEVLKGHGYRAVQVPTHRYFAPGRSMNAGFELSLTAEFTETKRRRIVPADSALKRGLEIARTTAQPLLLWVHLMEGHEPYRWRGGQGPFAAEGQRRAFRELEASVVAFLREYRRARAGRPVVVAVFGDHGEEFGEHGGRYHSTRVYAEQVRVAFALAAPGVPAAQLDAPVSLSSLPATVLDLLGLPLPRSVTEPSLLRCIAAREQCPDVAVSQMLVFGSWVGYTFERHRLVVDPEHDIERVYDSATDPLEQNDLARSEPALLDTLRERAHAFDRASCIRAERR